MSVSLLMTACRCRCDLLVEPEEVGRMEVPLYHATNVNVLVPVLRNLQFRR